jgi:hypothetical protein
MSAAQPTSSPSPLRPNSDGARNGFLRDRLIVLKRKIPNFALILATACRSAGDKRPGWPDSLPISNAGTHKDSTRDRPIAVAQVGRQHKPSHAPTYVSAIDAKLLDFTSIISIKLLPEYEMTLDNSVSIVKQV